MDQRAQIVQQFASVAEHAEQCYEFDIQGNLDTFFRCNRDDINFSEAAFLVYDAARIYGRKVDYLEQILLDFNQRSATNVSKAMAEVKAMAENAEQSEKKDKKADEAREKREREKDRALKRAKRMLKVTSKVEFKPKPFEIATSDQISLNLHEQRSELECEEEFDQLRMKNVFPRINVLQSNLQNNNTFYDNLGIEENDVENLDSLRDFRIFMDTIDEPIFTRPMIGTQVDPRYEQEYKRSMERANQKHSNIYLPAEYIKENYGITLKDNSDYLNMLKYNEEVERLNLRKLTIEQLSKLKVGTYLNNILHGNKQDGKITEHDSGIDVDDMDRDCEPPMPELPDFDGDNTMDGLTTFRDDLDVPMTELSGNDTNKEEDVLNLSIIPPPDDTLNTTEPTEQSLNVSTDQSEQQNTSSDSMLETSIDEANTSLETSKDIDRTNESRQSLDDGIGASECNSPSRLSEEFEGFNSTDMVEHGELNELSEMLNSAGEPVKLKVPELDTNIFVLPEKLLRRPKIFALTDEFELWMAARKRKFGVKPDPPSCGKLLKLSNGVVIRSDPDSDGEEFLGFDEHNELHTAPSMVVEEPNPAAIINRTCSSDSGFNPEIVPNGGEGCNQSQITPNGTEDVNDSGVADLSSSGETTLNTTGEATLNTTADVTLNTTTENGEQTIQETDLTMSDGNINANSTKLFNETASIVTGFDSGFSELESQLDSMVGLDETNNLETTTGATIEPAKTLEHADGDDFIDEDIDDENQHDDQSDDQQETARAEGFTDMVERVSKWHQMLRPVLANCEKRNNFDIHALGSDIIDNFPQDEEQQSEQTEISFTDVMKGRDQTYTARYFLSLLLLTNNKNVHLKVMHPENNGKVLCSKDDIRIKLRSRKRHLDEVKKIDQHLNEPKSQTKAKSSTSKTINISYEENAAADIQTTGKTGRGKKTTQKRKWNAT